LPLAIAVSTGSEEFASFSRSRPTISGFRGIRSLSKGKELTAIGIKTGYAFGCRTTSSCSIGFDAGGKRLPAGVYCTGEGGGCEEDEVEDLRVSSSEAEADMSLGIFRNISNNSNASKYGNVANSSESTLGS